MKLRRLLELGLIRDEVPPEGGGGGGSSGGDDTATELAKLRQRNQELERVAREHKSKADKEAADKEKANGEFGKIVERYEATIATLTGERDQFKGALEGVEKGKKADAFGKALAKELGLPELTPRVMGLLAISGEDAAPEKIDPKHVDKVVEKLRELDPELLPAGSPPRPPAAGGGKAVGQAGYWAKRARQAAGRES